MQENVKNATDFAFSDNVADMQTEIQSALQYKIINALEQKRIEIAMSLMQNEGTECDAESSDDEDSSDDEEDDEESDKDEKEDKKKKDKKSVKESELDEAQSMLSALKNSLSKPEPGSKLARKIQQHNSSIRSGKAGTWDKPTPPDGHRFDKKGFIRLGEEVEELEELSIGTMNDYIGKKQETTGKIRTPGISLAKKKIAKIEKQKKAYINARKW